METNERSAYDLLREWIANDFPVYTAAREVVQLNRGIRANYGDGLRDLILDIRSAPLAYRGLCVQVAKMPEYKGKQDMFSNGAAVGTMRRITDREFGRVDWSALADDLFPEEGE